jgi:IS5 family transposase
MDQVPLWPELKAPIRPHHPKGGNGPPPIYFETKAYIGVDSKSVCTTAASPADKHRMTDLLHGEERKVSGDGGYQGQGSAWNEATL